MASFAEDSDRLLEFIGKGSSMASACQSLKISEGTARKWVDQGRKAPDGKYGAWLARLTAAKAGASNHGEPDDDDRRLNLKEGVGPVEGCVDALVAGHELSRETDLAVQQAKALGRKIDELSVSPGAAAATSMTLASKRLQELVPALGASREDLVDQLRRAGSTRRGERPIDHWKPQAEHGASSNGKGSGEVEIKRGASPEPN